MNTCNGTSTQNQQDYGRSCEDCPHIRLLLCQCREASQQNLFAEKQRQPLERQLHDSGYKLKPKAEVPRIGTLVVTKTENKC